MTLELHATPEEVMRAVESLREFARARGVPEETVFDLALSLEECGSNIVNHAMQRDPQKTFHVTFEYCSGIFTIELRDGGPAFDPTAVAQRKPQAEDDDLPGGWGIELVRRNCDRIQYTRTNDENILRLAKAVGASALPPGEQNPHRMPD